MNIVKSFATCLELESPNSNIRGKKIEFAGRLCYRSESSISDESYKTFISNIVKKGHLSVLEHESVSILVPVYKTYLENLLFDEFSMGRKFFEVSDLVNETLVTANIRAWYEMFETFSFTTGIEISLYNTLRQEYDFIFTKKFDDNNNNRYKLAQLENYSKDIYTKHQTVSFHVQCSRSISHQLVRHRLHSFSQESQRYCNYSNNKFGNSVNCIIPRSVEDDMNVIAISNFIDMYKQAETNYFSMIEKGVKPEIAREVLPNGTATQLVMTANIDQWNRFINLRLDSHAQYEAQFLAKQIKEKINILIKK